MSRKDQKFKRFFRQKLGDLQKKKAIFLPTFRKFKRFRGSFFRMGGAIFNFSQKIGLKSTKNMQFCILHKPMGGARAPPAPPWLRYCMKSNFLIPQTSHSFITNMWKTLLPFLDQRKNALLFLTP